MKFFGISLCIFALSACYTSTNFDGIVDPNYSGSFHAKKIIVASSGFLIEDQKVIENSMIKYLAKYNVQVYRGLEHFPPTRKITTEERYKIAQDLGADSILTIKEEYKKSVKTYKTKTETLEDDSSDNLNNSILSSYKISNKKKYLWSQERTLNISATLKNPTNGATVWIAEGSTSGDDGAPFTDLRVNLSKKTVEELAKAGLITEK